MKPLVGLSETFKYADTYPSLSAWATMSEIDNEAINAIEKELNEGRNLQREHPAPLNAELINRQQTLLC